MNEQRKFRPKDFSSDQNVRWCPGCGDYAILAGVHRALAKQAIPPEQIAVVSGIGCSSRFPYYMSTYGFHTIHGRAPAFATGLKIAKPEMQVWVVTGDGDGLSIGGNHLIHVLRRNVDLNILMFNNRIYGLTKGQYSPTSEVGKTTKSTPMGSLDHPFKPLQVAAGADATFLARTLDVDAKVMQPVLAAAMAHKGTSFVEILQNCNIFNDGAWAAIAAKNIRADATLLLEHGAPMIFGADRDKGIRLVGLRPEVFVIGENGLTEADAWVHDAHDPEMTRTMILAQFESPKLPTPLGVIRSIERPRYDKGVHEQVNQAAVNGNKNLQEMLVGRRSWTV
ncbi:MAG TPA: 2-oxoacid:ferredoxin oxidoreductase subunit beta [Myxococcales bacterium]|nr:2-oxoacid:ferredoxin oxidoreductase subunit beta [Myxococcales bacterium]HAN32019.1 2-oxoacid:ferredoxin oxidoreductase subunit beta [Myxococcales bacterium]